MAPRRNTSTNSPSTSKRSKKAGANTFLAQTQAPLYTTRVGRVIKKPSRLGQEGFQNALGSTERTLGQKAEQTTRDAPTIRQTSSEDSEKAQIPAPGVQIARGPHFVRVDGQWIEAPPIMRTVAAGTSGPPYAGPLQEIVRTEQPTLLGLPIELRRQIYGDTLHFERILSCFSYEDALKARQGHAEILRLRHIQAEHDRLKAIRDNNAATLNGIQLKRLRELDQMDYLEEIEDVENSAKTADEFFDASLLEVSKQIHQEATVEFLRVNRFFVSDASQTPDATDTAVIFNTITRSLRVYPSKAVRILKHATWMNIAVAWQDVAILSTYLRRRQDLKKLGILFLGPVENKYELESFLRPLKILRANEVSLAWMGGGEEQNLRRETHIGLEWVRQLFRETMRQMQSGGATLEDQGPQLPDYCRENGT